MCYRWLMVLCISILLMVTHAVKAADIERINVFVINLGEAEEIDTQQLLTGEDSMLLFMPNGPQDVTQPVPLFTFSTLAELHALDYDQDDIIDQSDPVFYDLYLATLDVDNQVLSYAPIQAAGIVAIIFDRSYLIAEQENRVGRFAMRAGTVIMADNSRWRMQVVPIEACHLQNVWVEAVE